MTEGMQDQPDVSSDPFEDASPELQTFALAVDKDEEEEEKQDKLGVMRPGKKVPIHEKCRICLCGIEVANLIAPCECTGSMQYVHQDCLIKWLNTSFKGRCEVCFYQFKIRRNKVKLKNWKMLPMTSTQKAKYSIILSLHIIVFIFFLWSDYTLITQCINADKTTTNYWVKAAIVVVATITFIGFVIHQSRIYVRLFERWSVFNMKITNVFGKEEDVSRFSRRDDLSMSSGMYDQNSTGSIGRFFDMQ